MLRLSPSTYTISTLCSAPTGNIRQCCACLTSPGIHATAAVSRQNRKTACPALAFVAGTPQYELQLPRILQPPTTADPVAHLHTMAADKSSPQCGSQLVVLLAADAAALGLWRNGALVQHKVLTGYTSRRKQGKAQLTYVRSGGGAFPCLSPCTSGNGVHWLFEAYICGPRVTGRCWQSVTPAHGHLSQSKLGSFMSFVHPPHWLSKQCLW